MCRDKHLSTRLNNAWELISSFDTRQRKRLVLLCRAQEVVFNDPHNLLSIQSGLCGSPDDYASDVEQKTFFNFVSKHRDWIKSPIFSSILLDMCRSTPLRGPEVERQKLASWGKEISTCERGEDPLHLDYSCWFDEGKFDRALVAGTPPNPAIALRIQRSLREWRQKTQGKLLFPRMSRKQVSLATVREWERLFGREWVTSENDGGIEFTQETIEQVHHLDGVQLDGPCEIRQKWYKSGVVPRTYFAQGGTAYQKSKYIQGIAGDLTETLMTTHPISRLNPARIRLRDPSCYLRIYDLKAFTSNHWECKHFVERLGQWCLGTTVYVVDPVSGVLPADLGVLILDYNASCNRFPEYSLERIDEQFSEVTEFHNRAGFLGVYGNINFSTYLHGASLLMIVQSEDEANVAGDDAHYCEVPGFEDVSDAIISANGLLEASKVFRSDQVGAVCLKRGLIQVEQQCLPKPMLVFPSFSNIGELFGYRPPQFPISKLTKTERRSKVGTEVFRFLRAVFAARIDDDLESALDLLRAVYLSASFPQHGSLPPYGDILVPVLPDDHFALLTISPLDFLLRNHFSGGAVLPRYLEDDEDNGSLDLDLVSGSTWSGTTTRKLKYLEVLGYVGKEEVTEVLWGIQAYNRIVEIFGRERRKLYLWTCIQDVPVHLAEIPNEV